MTPPWPQSCTKAIVDEGGGTCRGTVLSGSSSLTEIGTCVPLASCSASNESLHAADNLTSPSLSSSRRLHTQFKDRSIGIAISDRWAARGSYRNSGRLLIGRND